MKRLVALLVLVLLAAPVQGKVILETGSETQIASPASPIGVFIDIPFQLDQPGDWYVKLLPLPDNPVYDGTPNGTLEPLAGWWVDFTLTDSSGSPITEDRNGDPIDGHLGYRVDGTPTEPIELAADTTYNLAVRLNIPAEGAATTGRVPFALAHVPTGDDAATENGAALHSSTGFTIHITANGGAGPITPGVPTTAPPGDDTGLPDQDGSGGPNQAAVGNTSPWTFMVFGGITVAIVAGWVVSSIVHARRIARVEAALASLQRQWKGSEER